MAEDMIEVLNPYAVSPANGGVSMSEAPRHESGNAIAAVSEASAVAGVKVRVLMAKQFPRDPMNATERILAECQRPTLAEAAVYSYPRSGQTVSGPSIRLAEVIARNWGNMTYGYEVLERRAPRGNTLATAGSSIIRAYAWDFETNVFIDRQFELKHWRGRKDGSGYPIYEDRDIYELEANMAARRIRSCILQVVPGDVTQAAVMACRKTASNGLTEMMADASRRQKLVAQMIRIFGKMGVTQDDLESFLNVKVDDWNADTMLKLKEVKTALEDNTVSLGDYFPRLSVENQSSVITKQQVKALMEAAKATGMQGKISDELHKMGISKFADVPAVRYDEVLAMIQGFGEPVTQEPAKKPDASKTGTAKAELQKPAEPEQTEPEPQPAEPPADLTALASKQGA